MHENALKLEWKNLEQNFLPLQVATPWQKLPVSMMLSLKFLIGKQW